jgi:CRISPR-associated protein Cst1
MSLLEWTGNPFVDSGIAAILVYCKKRKPEDVLREDFAHINELLQRVYFTEAWTSSLYSIFLNHPLNQSSYNLYEVINKETQERVAGVFSKQKAKKHIESAPDLEIKLAAKETKGKKQEEHKRFLKVLLEGVANLAQTGDCIACGRRQTRERKNRQHIPMTGSGGALNFFSFAAGGADYCDACAFAVQCSPLTYYACRKLALIHSNSAKVMRQWAQITLGNIERQIAQGNYTGCFNEGYTNPQNALFHLVQDLILKAREEWVEENPALRLYHFTNYIQGPELDIYDLPTPVFKFLLEVRGHPRAHDWRAIVNRGFYFVKKSRHINLNVKGKSEDEYKNSKNQVYQNLLAGRSILPRFLSIRTHKAYGDYSLLTVYLKEVLAMDKTRIETVRRVADDIALFIRHSDKGKTRLRNLEASVKFRDFCNVLRRISKERIELEGKVPSFTAEAPLIKFDEFAEQLFPNGALTFGETRYLILFRLYEQLHDWMRDQGVTVDEAEDEIEEIGDDKPLAASGVNEQTMEDTAQ